MEAVKGEDGLWGIEENGALVHDPEFTENQAKILAYLYSHYSLETFETAVKFLKDGMGIDFETL